MKPPTYVMHDEKRWRVERQEEAEGEQWYLLTHRNPRSGKPVSLYARVRECQDYHAPISRMVRGERHDPVVVALLRPARPISNGTMRRPPARKMDATVGLIYQLLVEAAAKERRAKRAHEKRMRGRR